MFKNIFLNWTFLKKNNVRINYFLFFNILNLVFFMNLFEGFFKFLKCRLFNKNSRISTESVCKLWDITETNNWIRLLILDDESHFYFLNLFLNNRLVYCRILLHFSSSLLNIFFKTDSQNHPSKIYNLWEF